MALMAPAGSELLGRRERQFGNNDIHRELTHSFEKNKTHSYMLAENIYNVFHMLSVFQMQTRTLAYDLLCMRFLVYLSLPLSQPILLSNPTQQHHDS